MENYFDSQLLSMKRELLALKQAKQKFAGSIPMVKQSVDVSIPLSLNSSQTSATGEKLFKITTTHDAILVPTLTTYYDDVTKHGQTPNTTRYMLPMLGRLSSNVFLVRIDAFGTQGNDSDVTTLINGGSVTLTNKLTVIGTDEFTLEAL